MSQFIESIKLHNGQLFLLSEHETRLNKTRAEVLGLDQPIHLHAFLYPLLKDYPKGLFKVRVLYAAGINKIEIHPYQQRSIRHLKVVAGNVDYTYKRANREALQQLYLQRGTCDDVIIIKDNLVTDSYYANLVFDDGQIWWTPSTPLLKGVQRAFLLQENIIKEGILHKEDIPSFKQVKLLNAMMDWVDAPVVAIENVVMF